MAEIGGRHILLGICVGVACSTTAIAQQLPDPLPALPPGYLASPPSVIVSPAPVIHVPPQGVQPTWYPPPIDPVAEARSTPGHVRAKSRSWFWRRSQGKVLGYPEDFEARPLGAAVYDNFRVQVANGAAARLTLYDYDFVAGTGQLNPRGRIQLAKLTEQLASSPFPLIIQNTPTNPSLANVRRNSVLAELAAGPFPVPTDRVLVGLPASHGLSGFEAQILSSNMLNRTQQYGPPIPLFASGVNSPNGGTGAATTGIGIINQSQGQ